MTVLVWLESLPGCRLLNHPCTVSVQRKKKAREFPKTSLIRVQILHVKAPASYPKPLLWFTIQYHYTGDLWDTSILPSIIIGTKPCVERSKMFWIFFTHYRDKTPDSEN